MTASAGPEPTAMLAASLSTSSFEGKVAIVTGGSRGLGESVARLMADRGAAGIVISGLEDTGLEVAESLGCEARFVEGDLVDPSTPDAIVAAADDAFGRVDVLVNAAGTTFRGSVWDTTADMWDTMLAVNTRAPALLTSAVARVMRREGEGGSIVNVGSIMAHGGYDFLYPYAPSKAALVALTRNAAWTLMRHRIRVNLVQPGWMDTPGEDHIQRTYHGATDGWREDAAATMPFGRIIDPAELARTICFLASAESGMMTGAIIDFDQAVIGAGAAPIPPIGPTWEEPQ